MSRELADRLSTKAAKIIDSSNEQHRASVERWLSLYNQRMHKLIENNDTPNCFGIIGMSLGIRHRFESKFGYFYPRGEPIRG